MSFHSVTGWVVSNKNMIKELPKVCLNVHCDQVLAHKLNYTKYKSLTFF